ncbi:hypothetical protein GCM10011514_17140 [Emticicia aquatilis]|uniref:histidine kinase n=2 Tax=Emticicia aquatilis TaxID=1537369 RepID=A0A916YN10_9BACT|nr:hypothetical protein GCM10011514_17140 [Emticicia aquatilis]
MGQKVLDINAASELPLKDFIFHLEHPEGDIDILQAIKLYENKKFILSESTTHRQNFGHNTKAKHWLSFEVNAAQKRELILEIEYANIDHIELFEVKNDEIRSLGFAGDIYKYEQRPYYNNNYVFLLRLEPNQKTQYFLHINQPNAILSFAIRLFQYDYFKKTDRQEYVVWGIYIGIIMILLVVNLVMLIIIKDWIYFWYILYQHCITMHLFSDAGLGFQYLWHDYPQFNIYDPVYLYIWGAMIAQLTFMQYFLHQTRRNSKVFKWIIAFKVFLTIALLTAISIHFFEPKGKEIYMYKAVATATSIFVLIMCILTVVSLYEKRNEKEKLVKYYAYALFFQFLGYTTVTLLNLSQSNGFNLPFDIETYVVMGIVVVIDIFFFSYGLVYRFESYKRQNQNLELNILNTKQESQKRIIESLEEERKRISQDLHDDIGATLATAKGYLSVLGRDKKSKELINAQIIIDKAAEELRTISHTLMPKNFNKIALSRTIDESIRKINSEKTQFDFITIGEPKKLSESDELVIFRILTELINNIQRHSEATEATIQLIYHADFLNLIVEDNGKGFGNATHDGKGIRNLYARAEYLKGELLIDSSEHGTSVILTVPTNNHLIAKAQ